MNNDTAGSVYGAGGTAVVGMFPDRQVAGEAERHLTEAGFSSDDLVLLGQAEVGAASADGRLGLPAEVEGGELRRDISWGTLGGALLGLLLGAEAVALTGIAGLIALGTLAGAATTGAATGAVYGDAQAGLDASEAASSLREEILSGKILIVIHAHGAGAAAKAREILDRAGAENVRAYALEEARIVT